MLDRLSDFRSAQEIHEELRRAGEGIGLTTVYRTLQTLADGGAVDVLRTARVRRSTGAAPRPSTTTTISSAGAAGGRWRSRDPQ